MADENPNIRKKFRKEAVDTNGGPWIRCPSQSHGGKMYYFNKLTGKAVWDLSDADMIKADLQKIPIEGLAVPCRPEPAEPPRDSASYSTYPDLSNPTIFNKQIINNQFAKPFAASPYVSPACHIIKLIPTAMYNPDIWNVPPFYLSAAQTPPTNQVEPSQGNYVNRQRFNKFKPQWKQNLLTNKAQQKFHNDLRQVLSSRRKDLIKEEGGSWNTHNEQKNVSTNDVCDDSINITEDELCPSDVDDEWLKTNSSGESNTVDTSPIWRLDRGDANPDLSFLVPTTAVLLNHLTFLSRLVKSDGRLRLLTPAAELRRLRARTAGPAPRLPRRARAAIRFATLQMHKVPVNLKNLQDGNIASCCMELIKQKYLVILIMTDEEESESRHVYDEIPTFTISDLKECLAQHPCAPKTESRENVVVISNELYTSTNPKNHEDICKDNNSSSAANTSVEINEECTNDINPVESPCVEIKKDQVSSLVKTTANASVQTDFEHNSMLSIESANSSSIVRTLETEHTLRVDTVIESSNDSKEEPKPRKIRLNRTQAAPKIEPVKQTTVKWRKRRVEPPKPNVNPNINEEKPTLPDKASLMDLRSDLLVQMNESVVQMNESAVDFGNDTDISERNAHMDEKGSNKESISVISNSVESETMFQVNKKAILSQPEVNEDIHMFEVTDDSMGEYLVMRRDEWVSRFVQIMEEALTQVLQSEPHREPAMPPPWSVHEASLCVKRNFGNNTKIVFASDKLTTVLHQISDSKGKIKSDLNPSEFMQMYSYGVNLIKHLQDVLNDSEDLHIAKTSLSKLLIDIREPHLDVTHDTFIDTFDDEQMSNTEIGMSVSDDTQPAPESPRAPPAASHASSPTKAKYNLRSQQQTTPTMTRPAVEDNCFFTSLRLQRNDSGDSASKALNTADQTSSPRQTSDPQPEPKIIRQFNVCADFEERLKKKRLLEEADDEYFAEDNHYTGTEFYLGEEDAGTPEAKDAADVEDAEDDADARTVLKWFMSRTTYPIHRVLVQIQRFCTDTYKELNKNERMEPEYITKLSAKTAKITIHMNNLCKYLNRILHRDTRSKFSYMLKQLGYEDAPMSPAQQAEYGAVVKRYLGQANILLEAVNLIAEAVQDAEYSMNQGKS